MTTEFTDFTTDIKKLVANIYEIDDLTGVMSIVLDAIGVQLDEDKTLVDDFTTIFDADRCNAQYLPYLAKEFGWDLDTNLTEYHQRKIVKLLMAIYREKGTKQGIISLIYLMLAVEATVTDINDYWVGWQIGIHQIGMTTHIGIGEQEPYMYHFYVNFPRALSTSERLAAHTLVKFMRPVHTHYTFIEA